MIHYEPTDVAAIGSPAVRRAQSFTLRAPSSATVVWPGEYLDLDIPSDLGDDPILALQPRNDTSISKHTKPTHIWTEPQVLEAVGSKMLIRTHCRAIDIFIFHDLLPSDHVAQLLEQQ